MRLAPWEYLFLSFSAHNFPDLFTPVWVASLLLLGATGALYVVRTRQVRHHPPFLDLYEWLLWTGIIYFGLLLTYSVFVFDFIFVAITIPVGVGIFLWIRFVRFPPLLGAYAQKLAKQRYWSRSKYAHPEATIRPKRGKRRRG